MPRRKKRLLIAVVLASFAVVTVALINGPLFRFALRVAIERTIAAAALEGITSVSGTLWTGPRLAAGAFKGVGPVQSLRFDELEVNYNLPRIARHGIFAGLTGIRASGLVAILESPQEKSTPPETGSSTEGSTASAWDFTALRNVPVALENISVRWLKGGETEFELVDLDLDLAMGGDGSLSLDQLLAPGDKSYENLHASFRVGESDVEITDFALCEELRITRLRLERHPVAPAIVTGSLELCGGHVALAYTPETHWSASLTEGAVDLATLGPLFGLDLIESGALSSLEVRLFDGESLAGDAIASLTSLRVRGLSADTARISLQFNGGELEIDALEITSGENRLEAQGTLALPTKEDKTPEDWLEDISGAFSLQAPQLKSVSDALDIPFGGNLSANISFAIAGGTVTRCNGDLKGTALKWADMEIASMDANLSCPRPGVPTADARIALDPAGENTIDGRTELEIETRRYAGIAAVGLKKIDALRPLLAAAGLSTPLGGRAVLDWNGSGDLRTREHRGSLAFTEAAVRIGDGEEIRGRGHLAYDPSGFDASGLDLAAGAFALRGGASLRDDVLTLSSIRLSKGESALAEGDATLPLDMNALKSPRAFFAQGGPLAVNLVCETLSIEELYTTFSPGGVPPVGGLFSGKITASGSLADMNLDSSLQLRGVAHPALEEVAPAEIDAALTVADGRFHLSGALRQELMEPITISGDAAFAPPRWIESPENWKNEDVALAVDLPETDLAVFLPFLPAISRLQGTASANLRLEGPAGAPRLSGRADSTIPLVKFRSERIPTIGNVDLSLAFEDREVRIERGTAEVAGGLIALGGNVSFESGLANPLFTLTVRAEQALIARDDYLNLRANADLTLEGPFSGATLAGGIAITESSYVRDVEILPLDVLRRTPSLPPDAGELGAVEFDPAITIPPFDQWRLDLRITTADPFLLRGNLANASASADITVQGTGGAPVVVGKVTLLEGEATLPFSKLKIQRGELIFDERGGVLPRINLEGVSSIRQYEIRVRLFDSVLDPKVILTSNPPLPQEDIATLLASGSTLDELGSREAVASKAFQLLAREVGRKVLRRKSTVEKKEFLPEDLEFSVGQVDAQTGRRTASSIYRVTPNLFLIGTLDEGGDSRGLLKILLRFD